MQQLQFGTASRFELIYNDGGSGASLDGAFYRPIPEKEFFILGDYGQNNYNDARGTVVTVQEIDRDDSHPLLTPPEDYVQIWTDRNSHAHMDGSFWQPVPPNGYVALGCVCQRGYDKPDLSKVYRCVRLDHVQFGTNGGLIWNDQKSGASGDVSVFGIKETNVIYAQGDYRDPNPAGFHIPKGL